MTKYIDKAVVVAEIKKRLLPVIRDKHYDEWEEGQDSERIAILGILDTLETKEVDLENSMVCKVDWYDGFLLDYTQEQQDALLEKIGANVGDKVRVILIKE